MSCARCPAARNQWAGLSKRTGEGENPRSDHFHHRPRRHSDVCQSHEGWSCRIPDQAISRPGAAGRYWRSRSTSIVPGARMTKAVSNLRALFDVIDPPRARGDGPGHGGPHEQADRRPIGRQRDHRKVHRGNAMGKMRARSLAELVRMADVLGIRRANA